MFDAETFVADCRAATVEPDAASAVREVVAAAIADPSSIDTALGTTMEQEPKPLFLSDELTVRRVLWPPGLATAPHEHRMWAVVGVYAGEERNYLYQRSAEGLAPLRECILNPGDVLVLGDDGIHAVDNALRSWTAGLHVYGGDLPHMERSAWGPDGREIAFAEWRASYAQLTEAMRDVATDHGRAIDDEARYLANRALLTSWERERRYLTTDEARHIITEAWHIEA